MKTPGSRQNGALTKVRDLPATTGKIKGRPFKRTDISQLLLLIRAELEGRPLADLLGAKSDPGLLYLLVRQEPD